MNAAFQTLAPLVLAVFAAADTSFRFDSGIPDARCPMFDDPANPVHLALPNDCTKFYKCFSGRVFTISCPAGQEYGTAIQRCDYPLFAQCRRGFAEPQPANFQYDEGMEDDRCLVSNDPRKPIHLPHKTDCERFYKCFEGKAFEFECPAGQHWGVRLNRCDFPTRAKCAKRASKHPEQILSAPANVHSIMKDQTNDEWSSANMAARKAMPMKAAFVYSTGISDVRCPRYDDPFRPIHLAHPTDCRKFQKCFDGRAYSIECPPGQEFGARINRCDYPQFAQCSAVQSKQLRKEADDEYEYYDYNYSYEDEMPVNSAEWTPEQREMIAGKVDDRCVPSDDDEPHHLSHAHDCGKFYKCFNGRAYLLRCPEGQHWSVRFDRCDYPQVAKCTARPL